MIFITIVVSLLHFFHFEKQYTRQANAYFRQKNINQAEYLYKKALNIENYLLEANYNLANTYFVQKRYNDAAMQYLIASDFAKDHRNQARIYHNLGNAFVRQEQYPQAIEAYKNALRRTPNDNQTRYNLAYAQQKLRQEQQNAPTPAPSNAPPNNSSQQKPNDQNNRTSDTKTALKTLMEQEKQTLEHYNQTNMQINTTNGKDW
jgi:tetratricopeptide (TPR) repeat protein